MGGEYNTNWRDEKCINNFGWKSRPPERPRREWEDNIRLDFREVGWEGVD